MSVLKGGESLSSRFDYGVCKRTFISHTRRGKRPMAVLGATGSSIPVCVRNRTRSMGLLVTGKGRATKFQPSHSFHTSHTRRFLFFFLPFRRMTRQSPAGAYSRLLLTRDGTPSAPTNLLLTFQKKTPVWLGAAGLGMYTVPSHPPKERKKASPAPLLVRPARPATKLSRPTLLSQRNQARWAGSR